MVGEELCPRAHIAAKEKDSQIRPALLDVLSQLPAPAPYIYQQQIHLLARPVNYAECFGSVSGFDSRIALPFQHECRKFAGFGISIDQKYGLGTVWLDGLGKWHMTLVYCCTCFVTSLGPRDSRLEDWRTVRFSTAHPEASR